MLYRVARVAALGAGVVVAAATAGCVEQGRAAAVSADNAALQQFYVEQLRADAARMDWQMAALASHQAVLAREVQVRDALLRDTREATARRIAALEAESAELRARLDQAEQAREAERGKMMSMARAPRRRIDASVPAPPRERPAAEAGGDSTFEFLVYGLKKMHKAPARKLDEALPYDATPAAGKASVRPVDEVVPYGTGP